MESLYNFSLPEIGLYILLDIYLFCCFFLTMLSFSNIIKSLKQNLELVIYRTSFSSRLLCMSGRSCHWRDNIRV